MVVKIIYNVTKDFFKKKKTFPFELLKNPETMHYGFHKNIKQLFSTLIIMRNVS